MAGTFPTWVLPLLRCPVCGEGFEFPGGGAEGRDGVLGHVASSCLERYPVIKGIPRLLQGAERRRLVMTHAPWFGAAPERRALAARWLSVSEGMPDPVVSAFDYEWSRFSAAGTRELAQVFDEYFDLIPEDRFASDQIVLDAGCGSGRWAFEVARRGPRVVAVDLGNSIEIAQRNTARTGRVACVQADVRDLPLAAASVDWAYSIGVLHHVDSPATALRRICNAVRPGGPVLTYLYYALDDRAAVLRWLFRLTTMVRAVTSRLPRPLSLAFGAVIAVTVYWPLARFARVAEHFGWTRLARSLPLSYYRSRSLALMLNDSLDRFGTSREVRYRRQDIAALYARCGISSIVVSEHAPYWHAVGLREPS